MKNIDYGVSGHRGNLSNSIKFWLWEMLDLTSALTGRVTETQTARLTNLHFEIKVSTIPVSASGINSPWTIFVLETVGKYNDPASGVTGTSQDLRTNLEANFTNEFAWRVLSVINPLAAFSPKGTTDYEHGWSYFGAMYMTPGKNTGPVYQSNEEFATTGVDTRFWLAFLRSQAVPATDSEQVAIEAEYQLGWLEGEKSPAHWMELVD